MIAATGASAFRRIRTRRIDLSKPTIQEHHQSIGIGRAWPSRQLVNVMGGGLERGQRRDRRRQRLTRHSCVVGGRDRHGEDRNGRIQGARDLSRPRCSSPSLTANRELVLLADSGGLPRRKTAGMRAPPVPTTCPKVPQRVQQDVSVLERTQVPPLAEGRRAPQGHSGDRPDAFRAGAKPRRSSPQRPPTPETKSRQSDSKNAPWIASSDDESMRDPADLVAEWREFERDLSTLEHSTNASKNGGPVFAFVEGALVTALARDTGSTG